MFPKSSEYTLCVPLSIRKTEPYQYKYKKVIKMHFIIVLITYKSS